ncbi:MAG TPA: electron transfer flavoprotein subunit beta/FixA family protein [Chloroflexota bacterium]|nr:electron transfer flavoprotein subunit beta/FixA family protein [Chloroflexota bacterium]
MHAVVTLKQVPDTAEVRIDPRTNTMIRSGVPSIVNPDDVHAIEEAVRLKERFGGKVTAVTMGPSQAAAALREAISYGADEGILCGDRGFAGADTLATSYVLWKALTRIDREEAVDIVLCGRQALDGDTGQVPPGLATRLGWPQLTSVLKIEEIDFDKRFVVVHRLVEGGREVVRARLPAVLTCTRELNTPRYPTFPNMVRAAKYQPVLWDKVALEIPDDDPNIGLRGSPTIVSKVWAPAPRQRPNSRLIEGSDPERAADELLRVLTELGVGSLSGTRASQPTGENVAESVAIQ